MNKFYLIQAFVFCTIIALSQIGPGGVGTSATNVLWLKADQGTSSTINGTALSSWNDQSGNSSSVTQTIATQQPSFATNVINGYPAVQFDNISGTNDKMIGSDAPTLDNTSGYTFFTVSRPQILDGGARVVVSKRTAVAVDQSFMLFYYTGNKFHVDIQTNNDRFNSTSTYAANTNYLIDVLYDGSLTAANRSKIYNEESLNITASETSSLVTDNASPLIIGSTDLSDGRPFGGYISEVIIYRTTLNPASRIIVNNYLSAKYNIALSANDKYNGDMPANGDYDRDVAGIGSESTGSSPTFSASTTLGMGISALSGLNDGDYVLAGHSVVSNAVNLSDVSGISGINPERWERVWYIDVTNTGAAIQAAVEFDMVNGGMSGVIPATASNYKLLYRTGLSGVWTEVATASSISGNKVIFSSYSFNSNSDDGYYTIGTRDYMGSPLPIKLISFDAIINGENVDITWSTATEINNDYYTIEKSKDGIHFEPISVVRAAGNSLNILNYKVIDKNPFNGISYYRLKQTDFNGAFSYSAIVDVDYNLSDNRITIFPNPTDGEISLMIKDSEKTEVLVVIIDSSGKEVYSKFIVTKEDNQVITLDFEKKLSSGTYIVIANTNYKLYSQKIIIK